MSTHPDRESSTTDPPAREAGPNPAEPSTAGQYLLLSAGGATYALDIFAADEVLRMAALAPKPGAPPWLRGYLNLRGDVLPVIDLRTRLRDEKPPLSLDDLIVIARTDSRRAGLIVDAVSDVVALAFPHEGSKVTRHGHMPVFLLDPGPYIEEAYAV